MDVIHKIGRRKTSVARVYFSNGPGVIKVNGKEYAEYFPSEVSRYKILQPFSLTNTMSQYNVNATVVGGGTTGQAEAIRLAISRALVEVDEANKSLLKVDGLLTRDARIVERKKYGRKKARKRFQFSKR